MPDFGIARLTVEKPDGVAAGPERNHAVAIEQVEQDRHAGAVDDIAGRRRGEAGTVQDNQTDFGTSAHRFAAVATWMTNSDRSGSKPTPRGPYRIGAPKPLALIAAPTSSVAQARVRMVAGGWPAVW